MHCENCNIYVKNLRQHMKSQKHIKVINEVSKGDYTQLITEKDYSNCNLCNLQEKILKRNCKS